MILLNKETYDGSNKLGSNSKLCVATTHIFFNRKRGIIKIGQLDILLTKIKDVIKEEDIPIGRGYIYLNFIRLQVLNNRISYYFI